MGSGVSSQAGGPRAGMIRGGRDGSPMWVRICSTGAASVMNAMMRMSAPQLGCVSHTKSSRRKTGFHQSNRVCWPAIVAALESAGIATLELKPRQQDPGQEQAGVRYGTKKRIKGLEFKAIALLYDNDNAGDDDSAQRFANYVAATRAREHLLVVKLAADIAE
jgi:hypothetical protein